jgi:hypothetical protein
MNKEIKRTRGLDITEEENSSWEGRISFLTRKATRHYDKYNKHTVELLGNMLITQFKCMKNQAEENEKVIKIIAKKRVNILDISLSSNAKEYNERMKLYSLVDYFEELYLTDEEFNTVKKVVSIYGTN